MLYLLHMHWLLFFGGLGLGIVVGWLTYLRAATRWTDRTVRIAIGAVAIGALVAIAKVVPGRYGFWLELGVVLAGFYIVGCFIGWALRDLAESTPATAKSSAAASAAMTGSYLFRNAFSGTGASTAYMRSPAAEGRIARERLAMVIKSPAPAPGGYTFPKVLPFADVPTSWRAEPTTGLRRHWSWPRPSGAANGDSATSRISSEAD